MPWRTRRRPSRTSPSSIARLGHPTLVWSFGHARCLGISVVTSLQVTTAVAEPEGHRVSIVGRLDRINALLRADLHSQGLAGSATLSISVTDEAGQTGSGAIDFSIAPINDPPRFVAEWDAPSRLVMDEDGAASAAVET